MPALAVLMPYVWTALRIFLVANIAGFVLRVLTALGITIFVLEPAVDTLMGLLAGEFGVLPAEVAAWVGFFNIDRYVSIVISAYAIQTYANFVFRINR